MNCYCVICGVLLAALLCAAGQSAILGGPVVGGYQKVKPDDDTVVKAAKFGLEQMQLKENELYASRQGAIEKAFSQVVAGVNYVITFNVEYTNCRAPQNGGTEDVNSASCAVTKTKKCTVVVWYRPWMEPKMILTDSKCDP